MQVSVTANVYAEHHGAPYKHASARSSGTEAPARSMLKIFARVICAVAEVPALAACLMAPARHLERASGKV